MRVLLHTCCGPCASACLTRLKDCGHEVVMFYSNSNIDTAEEFEKRRLSAVRLAEADGVKMETGEYLHDEWLDNVARGYENEKEKGERCERCFRYNLMKTAAFAKANGYDAFSTSLTVSPHKVSRVIFKCGTDGEIESGVKFLAEDFKKRDGFKLSCRRALELGLYRQSYCGCEFSRRDTEVRNQSDV